jgi:hypothetical protein
MSFRAWVVLLLLGASAQAAPLKSGLYEGLMLAVAPDGAVQGHYLELQGEGPSKRCAFFLAGPGSSGRVQINSWSAVGTMEGTLSTHEDGVLLSTQGGRDHDGCGMVLLPLIDRGLPLSKVADGGWTQLRVVRDTRLFFHAAPQASTRRQGYLVRGDVVGISQEVEGWALAEFVNRTTGRRTSGWLATDGLALLDASRIRSK